MDKTLCTIMSGLGFILIVSRSGIAAPGRAVILKLLDCVILFIAKWRHFKFVDNIIATYVNSRYEGFCMMCFGFWTGVGMHYLAPLMDWAILDGCLFSAVGWLATKLESVSFRLS